MIALKSRMVLVCLTIGILLGGVSVIGVSDVFAQNHYYILPIGEVQVSTASLIVTAKDKTYTVIVYEAGTTTAYRGSAQTKEPEAVLLSAASLLYVDESRFLLSVAGTDFDYVVRPYETGYALLLIPHRDLPQGETLLTVLDSLRGMGIIGEEVEIQGIISLEKKPEKSPAPPDGVAMDSSLFGLSVAADWFSDAVARGLNREGLRVEVVAEKLPGAAVPQSFQPYIVSETEDLAKLLVPIHLLVNLARASGIGYVRPPYQPAVP
jgi:hypothetical protein